MTLLYIHQYFVFPDTPGATRSYDLATSFAKEGMEVIVVTSSSFLQGDFKKRWTILKREGLVVHVLRSNYSNQLSFLKRIMVFLSFMLFTSFRVLSVRANLVLATSTPITVAVPALLKKLLQGTKYVFEVRDVWPEAPVAMGAVKSPLLKWLLNVFEKHIYRRASHVVALSPDMKNSIVRRTKIPEEKITVIPNIANLERFSHFSSENSLLKKLIGFVPARSVLYAGTFGIVNGVENLLAFIHDVSAIDPDIKFIFSGWGSRKQETIDKAKEMGLLNTNVFFITPLPKDQMPQLYAECTVAASFVIPVKELWANSANKFFDSLAAAKPIVINYGGWQAAAIKTHNIGYVLEPGNFDAQHFCSYLNNRSLLEQQGNNARTVARENYALPLAVNHYRQIFNTIA